MKGTSALTVVTLLIVGVYGRPSPQLKQLKSLVDILSQDLSSSEELMLLDSMDELGMPPSGPRPRDTLLAPDSAQMPPNRAWLRVFSDFMNNQKKFRGRTRKSGTSRGCFGMKLERIGTMSGLGC
ncbi:C-type natriuretic peptide-like [Hyla sarda]|uniref:C-type natriuretic peptide-like n=1 Tax=Hyla sarda TaxID=327740 RepID=UPI0024C31D39|nr:C-type natriuretic peptide-like [Hyla sarda]XP_056409625.1 C-type natriuretic peptide-like [Hyla sarda]XP_056409626.1 C-type natriuretic peptide-like [Hyla sarda]